MSYYTEKEHLINSNHYAYRLRHLYMNNKKLFNEMMDYIPNPVFINKKDSLDIVYANNRLLNKGPEMEELVSKGASYLKDISCPLLMQSAIKKASVFKTLNDKDAVCNYFQELKVNGKMTYFYSNKLHLDDNLYFNMSHFMDDMVGIGRIMTSVFKPIKKNSTKWQQFETLTKQEKIILKLLANGRSNKQVAEKLFISEHTVHTHRKNIYRKLDINSISELVKYALALHIL